MQWVAHYNDGSKLTQFNDDGSENRYASIDRQRLESFALYEGESKIIDVHLEPGQRLIYRRRVEQPMDGDTIAVYMVGWQQTVGGQNIQSIAYVFPNGQIELAGKWREDHRWFYSPQLLPHES